MNYEQTLRRCSAEKDEMASRTYSPNGRTEMVMYLASATCFAAIRLNLVLHTPSIKEN